MYFNIIRNTICMYVGFFRNIIASICMYLILCSVYVKATAVPDIFFAPKSAARSDTRAKFFDLRKSLRVSTPIDQQKCGACYISAAATILQYWAGLHISPQTIIDCSQHFTCRGGSILSVIQWSTSNAIPVGRRPFSAKAGKCKDFNALSIIVNDFQVALKPSDAESILWQYGPMGAYIRDPGDLEYYSEGILEHKDCSRGKLHAVAVVGYTPEYWIIKNSWGTQWGHGGYGYVRKGACKLTDRLIYVKDATLKKV